MRVVTEENVIEGSDGDVERAGRWMVVCEEKLSLSTS